MKCEVEFTTIVHIIDMIDSVETYLGRAHFPLDEGKKFIAREDCGWTGCDNTTGDCWVEHFDRMTDCLAWLYGMIGSDGYPICYDLREWIEDALLALRDTVTD